MNILANATGATTKLPTGTRTINSGTSASKTNPTLTVKNENIKELSAKLIAGIQARQLGAKIQVRTMDNYPHLIPYVRIGYGSKADYQGFGNWVYDYFKSRGDHGKVPNFPSKDTRNKLNALANNYICENPVSSLGIKTEYPSFQFYNSTAFGSDTYWKKFSTLYYPTKIKQVVVRINQYFQGDFKKDLTEIITETDEAKQKEKEKQKIDYITNDLLREIITGVVMEDEDGKEKYIDTIESFFLAPQEVLAEQFKYVNEIERQEGAHSKAMKSSVKNRFWTPIAYDNAVNTINTVYSGVNYINRILYQKGLNAYQPERDFKQILHENIAEASKWLKETRAITASKQLSERFTAELAPTVRRINTGEEQYNPPEKNATKSDGKMLLIGAAILGGIYFIKKRKK